MQGETRREAGRVEKGKQQAGCELVQENPLHYRSVLLRVPPLQGCHRSRQRGGGDKVGLCLLLALMVSWGGGGLPIAKKTHSTHMNSH